MDDVAAMPTLPSPVEREGSQLWVRWIDGLVALPHHHPFPAMTCDSLASGTVVTPAPEPSDDDVDAMRYPKGHILQTHYWGAMLRKQEGKLVLAESPQLLIPVDLEFELPASSSEPEAPAKRGWISSWNGKWSLAADDVAVAFPSIDIGTDRGDPQRETRREVWFWSTATGMVLRMPLTSGLPRWAEAGRFRDASLVSPDTGSKLLTGRLTAERLAWVREQFAKANAGTPDNAGK